MSKQKYLITIAGPTAVGKTSTTIALSKHFGADIFSADSRQLYREMNIGTAKPTKVELLQAKHYFIDCVSVTEHYNAGRYEREFDKLIASYFQEKDIAILTGGTGMYIRAAIEGLDDFPDIPSHIKEKYSAILENEGLEKLQDLIKLKDPKYAAQVDMYNARRLTRALEVIETSGRTFTSYLQQKAKNKSGFIPIKICLTRDREQLYNRINQRVDLMMSAGQLDEVQSLMKYKNLKALQTVGYSELIRHLDREISLEEAVELIKRNSRRYAKRQMTWFRNQGEWKMIDAEDYEGLLFYIKSILK